jgi:hypothetical protein
MAPAPAAIKEKEKGDTMSNDLLTTIEQIGFDSRHPKYASWLENPEIIPDGLWVKDSELGSVLIFYKYDEQMTVGFSKLYIKSSIADTPVNIATSWWDTFFQSFKKEVAERTSSFATGSAISLSVLLVIGAVVFLILYAPRPK